MICDNDQTRLVISVPKLGRAFCPVTSNFAQTYCLYTKLSLWLRPTACPCQVTFEVFDQSLAVWKYEMIFLRLIAFYSGSVVVLLYWYINCYDQNKGPSNYYSSVEVLSKTFVSRTLNTFYKLCKDRIEILLLYFHGLHMFYPQDI